MSSRSSILRSVFGASSSDNGGIVNAPFRRGCRGSGSGNGSGGFSIVFGRFAITGGRRSSAGSLSASTAATRTDGTSAGSFGTATTGSGLLGLLGLLCEQRLPLTRASAFVEPAPERAEHPRPARPAYSSGRREHPAERELRREHDREKQKRQDDDDRSRPVQVFRHPRGEPFAEIAAGPEGFAVDIDAAERQTQQRADTAEQEAGADELRVLRIKRTAPEVVPSEDDHRGGDEMRRVAEQLKRQLGEKCADAAGEICGLRGGAGAEEPYRVGRLVGGQRYQPDERGGEQRDAEEFADPA